MLGLSAVVFFILNLKEFIMNEATQREVFSVIVRVVVALSVAAVVHTVLSLVLWAWLAAVITLIASAVASHLAGVYAKADGYDLAVNACASVLTFFRKTVKA